MKKKTLVSMGIICGVLLVSGGVAYSDELKESLQLYLQDSSLDFLGHEFEELLFQNLHNGEGNYFVNELKFIVDDIKTMPLQLQAYYKIFTHKVNVGVYGLLGGTAGLKSAIGIKEFNKIAIKLLKLVIR